MKCGGIRKEPDTGYKGIRKEPDTGHKGIVESLTPVIRSLTPDGGKVPDTRQSQKCALRRGRQGMVALAA